MKKKILSIFMCMLLLAMIPVSVGLAMEEKKEPDTGTTDIGRTIVRGFFFNYRQVGLKNQFFALRIHYTEMTGSETTMGIARLNRVRVGKLCGGYIREGPVGLFGYMGLAVFKGGIEIL